MAENELVRIEIGFHGGDVLAARVPLANADLLEDHLRRREDAVVEVEAQDARYLVVLARVLYVKRYARESRVGFSSG
jgi:hypothetical protein